MVVSFRDGAESMEIVEQATPAGPTGAFRNLYLLFEVQWKSMFFVKNLVFTQGFVYTDGTDGTDGRTGQVT